MNRIVRAAFLALPLALALATSAFAQDRTFSKPRFRDDRLDWCLTWGANCGQPAADAFCQRKRFTRARVFGAERVGHAAPTRLMGTEEVCRGDFCTAFAYVTCADPVPASQVFVNPAWQGFRLDVCQQWGANCGKPAADAFCRARGFAQAMAFAADAQPGYAATRVIGSGEVCRGSFCRGFQQVICK